MLFLNISLFSSKNKKGPGRYSLAKNAHEMQRIDYIPDQNFFDSKTFRDSKTFLFEFPSF
jgi:hypothetical protein